MNCNCKPTDAALSLDNSACPTHGPNAPRYFVDHGMIHDRITGKHVEIEEAAGMLSVDPDAMQRIGFGIATDLGQMLIAMTKERDALRALVTEIRNGRYSIKTKLDRRDRELFDRLNHFVDELLARGPATTTNGASDGE